MRFTISAVVFGVLIVGGPGEAGPERLRSGLDVDALDRRVRPQDDLYRFVNGRWLLTTRIPDDRVTYGTFTELADTVEEQVRTLIEEAIAAKDRDADAQRVVDLYASMMDEARTEALGAAPIRPQLEKIDAIATPRAFATEAGRLSAMGAGGPFSGTLDVDPVNPRSLVVRVAQGGTLLREPRDYLGDAAALAELRAQYERYLARIFTLAERAHADRDARAVLALEIALARAQSPPAAGSDGASRFLLSRLQADMPGFDWIAWAEPQGLDRAAYLILEPPSFFRTFASLAASVPLETWKAWLAARYLTASAPYLDKAFGDARFDFLGRILTGQRAPRPRWKRAVSLVNGYLGDAVGRLYVARYMTPAVKPRVERLVRHVIDAYRQLVGRARWMPPASKNKALDALATMTAKIAYPDAWRSYGRLEIAPDDLVGNIQRAQKFENDERLRRVRNPARAREWLITPQTVNAYYDPRRHEIVVPAAMLQPPLFDPGAEDAVNFGGIGTIVAHEVAHALEEHAGFQTRALGLVDQFNALWPLDEMHVDGARTFRENLADLVGVSAAREAYRLSLDGRSPPKLDGFTGDQRFFMRWARLWRTLDRAEYLRQALATNPYPPFGYRANAVVTNLPSFYEAFGVKRGDKLYRGRDNRVKIW